ncbi:protein S100-A16 [Aplochiton taeniatus]
MESAIKTVVGVYLKSAKGKGSLGGKDFDNLVKKQLGNIMEDTDSASAMKEMRAGLDENNDGKVSFPEYLSLIGHLAKSYSQLKSNGQQAP